MLRSWTIRSSVFLSAAKLNVRHKHVYNAERSLLAHSSFWKLRNASGQRCLHENVAREKPAHIFHHGSAPIVDETAGKLLTTAAERWPDREFLVSLHQDMRFTFSQILRRADRFAAGLVKLGMKRGDRIGLWGPNNVEWVIGLMAAARVGLVVAAINSTYQINEITYAVQKVGVKAVISPASFKSQNYPRMLLEVQPMCPTLEHIIIHADDHVTGTRRFSDVEALASRIEVERIAAEQDEISCHAGCNIQFTSGTTGRPKATVVSHRSVVNNSKHVSLRAQMNEEQKICLNVPLFHAFGILKGLFCALQSGSTLVLQAPSFNPVKSIEAILREKCNVVYGTPTMWINLLDAHRRLQPPPITLSYGVTGGSPASPELFRNIRETFRFDKMTTIYGLTETTAAIFQSLPNERHELTENTVGHVGDHVEVMVVDENKQVVPFGVPGELWVRGYPIMLEYFGDEESTKKTITEDGWLQTGDQFILRSDGYGHIVGRLKDMLIRGGENIFPKEIEDVLMTHPQVSEAQVIGAYDKVYGEEVCACVRVKDGARITKEDLREYCKGRMAPYKIPRYVEFVHEYPKTASGKVQKHILREEMERQGVIPSNPENIAFAPTAPANN